MTTKRVFVIGVLILCGFAFALKNTRDQQQQAAFEKASRERAHERLRLQDQSNVPAGWELLDGSKSASEQLHDKPAAPRTDARAQEEAAVQARADSTEATQSRPRQPILTTTTVSEVMTPRGALRVGDTMDDSLERLKSGTRTSFDLAGDRFVGVYVFPSGMYRITFDRSTGQFRIQQTERIEWQ